MESNLFILFFESFFLISCPVGGEKLKCFGATVAYLFLEFLGWVCKGGFYCMHWTVALLKRVMGFWWFCV